MWPEWYRVSRRASRDSRQLSRTSENVAARSPITRRTFFACVSERNIVLALCSSLTYEPEDVGEGPAAVVDLPKSWRQQRDGRQFAVSNCAKESVSRTLTVPVRAQPKTFQEGPATVRGSAAVTVATMSARTSSGSDPHTSTSQASSASAVATAPVFAPFELAAVSESSQVPVLAGLISLGFKSPILHLERSHAFACGRFSLRRGELRPFSATDAFRICGCVLPQLAWAFSSSATGNRMSRTWREAGS